MDLFIAGAITALITYALPKLIEGVFRRRVDTTTAEKMRAERDALVRKSDLETTESLTAQLHEAQESIKRYRRRLREHGIDPDSDTGPLKPETEME